MHGELTMCIACNHAQSLHAIYGAMHGELHMTVDMACSDTQSVHACKHGELTVYMYMFIMAIMLNPCSAYTMRGELTACVICLPRPMAV